MATVNVEVPVSIDPLEYGSFPMDLELERPLSEIGPFVQKMLSAKPGDIPTRRLQVQYGTGMDAFGYVVGDPLDPTKPLILNGVRDPSTNAGASSFPGPNDFAMTIRLVDPDDVAFVVHYPYNRFGQTTLPDRTPLS